MRSRNGFAMIYAVAYAGVVMAFAAAFLLYFNRTQDGLYRAHQAQMGRDVAEGGLEKAVAELRKAPTDYHGETNSPLGDGRFTVTVEPGDSPQAYRITAVGDILSGAFVTSHIRAYAVLVLGPGGTVASYHVYKEAPWL